MSHMCARADRRQGSGLVGDKVLQDKQDSLHTTRTYFAAAAKHCSRGSEDGLCG